MSPDLIFILTLALRMAVTAAFVVTASVITERSGPVIGALVATLPISAGPSYVFLALDHDAAFIAEGALASLPVNAATIVLALTYAVLAQRHGLVLSLSVAIVIWFAGAAALRLNNWTPLTAAILNVAVFGVPDPKFVENVAAWVKVRDGQEVTEEEIRAFCRARLAYYKVPEYIRFVDAFPMTLSGKVQKFKMREFEIATRSLEAVANQRTA